MTFVRYKLFEMVRETSVEIELPSCDVIMPGNAPDNRDVVLNNRDAFSTQAAYTVFVYNTETVGGSASRSVCLEV